MVTTESTETRTVELRLYEPKYHLALQSFYLPREQIRYTALPSEILEKSIQDPDRNPTIILSDKKPVGFFVLCAREMIRPYTSNPNALLFYAFSINHAAQGNGYAKRALHELPAFVRQHFPGANEIILSVHADNLPAKQLYLKTGFQDKGMRKLGSHGLEVVMHFPFTSTE